MKKYLQKIGNWEQWPFKILYAPIAPVWLWYIIRSGSVWFFTPSNPKLTFGGMEGEPKKEMYDLLPRQLYPATFNVFPGEEFKKIYGRLSVHHIDYPFIVKPEVAGQGILLRKIDNEDQLKKYHQNITVEYIIQEMIPYPMEVSAFYYRFPDQPKGVVTGFLHKIPLQVTGDGVHTVEELVRQNPKAVKRAGELAAKHGNNFKSILPQGEKYMLSYAANHNRGAHFINLNHEIDEKLVQIFDAISTDINDFYYGRYDIMCSSLEDLRNGKNFLILEYNGCGAEPNHFYDTGFTLAGAYREILMHWKVLFRISRYNYEHGVPYWPLLKGIQFLLKTKKHYRLIRKADKLMP
ncbi:MAG: hypothetical protein ABJA57_12565 [Ginsengibacter sp.]